MRYPAFIAAIAAVIAAGTALLLGGCVGSPARIESRTLAGQLGQSPEHYIVAAVENDRSAFVGHAASTPRGYDGVGAYGPTPHALNVMQSIESDYRLREVKSWPIAPLHMHCAILEIAADADRGALLAALGHDPRIRLAEPLQVFATRTEYNDPYVGLQRGFQQMDVADAHPISNGAGVRIRARIILTPICAGPLFSRSISSTMTTGNFGVIGMGQKSPASSQRSPTITKELSVWPPAPACRYSRPAGN
jgi:hypothetical protein